VNALAPIISGTRGITRTVNTGPVDLRLKNGDLYYAAGNLFFVTGSEWLQQAIVTNLRSVKGDWFIDPTFGVPYFEQILVKGPNLPLIRSVLKRAILAVKYVKSVDEITLDYQRADRELRVTFTATPSLPGADVIEATVTLPFAGIPAYAGGDLSGRTPPAAVDSGGGDGTTPTSGFDQPSDEEMN